MAHLIPFSSQFGTNVPILLEYQVRNQIVTVRDFLLGACFVVPICAAFRAAEIARASVGGYLLTMLAACLIGTSFAFLMRAVDRRLTDTFEHSPPSTFRVFSIVSIVAECIWIEIAGIASSRIAAVLLHWVR